MQTIWAVVIVVVVVIIVLAILGAICFNGNRRFNNNVFNNNGGYNRNGFRGTGARRAIGQRGISRGGAWNRRVNIQQCYQVSAVTLQSAWVPGVTAASGTTFAITNNSTVGFNPGITLITSTTPVIFPVAALQARGTGRCQQLTPGPAGATVFSQIILADNCGGCQEIVVAVSTTFVLETAGGTSGANSNTFLAQVQFVPSSLTGNLIVGAPSPAQTVFPVNTIYGDTTFTMTPVVFKTKVSGYFQVVVQSTIASLTGNLTGQGEFTVVSLCNPCPKAIKLITQTCVQCQCTPCICWCEVCQCTKPCSCDNGGGCQTCGCNPCQCGGGGGGGWRCQTCGCNPCQCGGGGGGGRCNTCGCDPCEC